MHLMQIICDIIVNRDFFPVNFGWPPVTYGSMDEMIRLLNFMIRTREKRTTRVPATFAKGL